jgi:hypothetical protein
MSMKRSLQVSTAMLAVALGSAATAFAAAPTSDSLVIRHQVRGCHSWSLNTGAYKASQSLTLPVKGTLTVTNNDVMPHALVQLSGPAAQVKTTASSHMMGALMNSATMGQMGATAKVTFPKKGVYVFKTKAGDDYPMFKNLKTVGEDNVLRLVVRVS